MRRHSEAAQRAADRRAREDSARRLHDLVPDLAGLTIRFVERSTESPEAQLTHVRHVVVDRAPALFEVPCCDRNCNGKHDLTERLLKSLRKHEKHFEGSDRCIGTAKLGDCALELHFTVDADYQSAA
jgi:hypothetical protein